MEKKCVVAGVVLSLCAACGSSSHDDPASDDPLGVIRQASHGPVSNVMVRLLDTPSRDTVLCDGRVRGLAPSVLQTYQSTVTISYPTAASVQRTGSVSLADPLDVNNADGQFMVELVENPPGSGEYMVHAEFTRKTTERTAGTHRCTFTTLVTNGGGAPQTILESVGEASHAVTANGPWRQSTWHRDSGSNVICQSRLNNADPAATYAVSVQATTNGGTGNGNAVLDPGAAMVGPIPVAGGSYTVERTTNTSVDVRFDFAGQATTPQSTCAMQIRDGIATSAPVVLNSTTRVRPPGSIFTFRPILQGCNEGSPNLSTATGLGLITVDTGANLLGYRITFSGLSSAETMAHIHGFAPRGTDAGVVFTLGLGDPKIGGFAMTAPQTSNILSGLSYVNIHSDNFPNGEIRGQIDDSKTPCGANVVVYDFPIEGCQETPPVNTQATGRGTVVVNTATNTLHYVITFSGLSSAETMAHIHGPAFRNVPAGILLDLPAGNPKVGTLPLNDTQEANILAGQTYVNIHSGNFPNGEIRGQIDNLGNCQPPPLGI